MTEPGQGKADPRHWVNGTDPSAILTTSLNWRIKLKSHNAVEHRGIIEGGQGKKWFVTNCGHWFTAVQVEVLPEGKAPKPDDKACKRCWWG
jgi:hypothetical protein